MCQAIYCLIIQVEAAPSIEQISGREIREICRGKEADSLCDQLYKSPPFPPSSNNFLSAHRKGIYRMCLWEGWGLGVPCISGSWGGGGGVTEFYCRFKKKKKQSKFLQTRKDKGGSLYRNVHSTHSPGSHKAAMFSCLSVRGGSLLSPPPAASGSAHPVTET